MQNRVRDDAYNRNDRDDTGDNRASWLALRRDGVLLNAGLFGARAHVVPFLVRLVIGGIFLAAGILKIGHPAALAAAITAYQVGLPPVFVAGLALALPPFEILLGIYLIAGLLLPLSSAVAALMLALFSAIVASVVIRGLSAPCGCFGPGDTQPATWMTVLRDVSLLIGAAYLVWWSHARARLSTQVSSAE